MVFQELQNLRNGLQEFKAKPTLKQPLRQFLMVGVASTAGLERSNTNLFRDHSHAEGTDYGCFGRLLRPRQWFGFRQKSPSVGLPSSAQPRKPSKCLKGDVHLGQSGTTESFEQQCEKIGSFEDVDKASKRSDTGSEHDLSKGSDFGRLLRRVRKSVGVTKVNFFKRLRAVMSLVTLKMSLRHPRAVSKDKEERNTPVILEPTLTNAICNYQQKFESLKRSVNTLMNNKESLMNNANMKQVDKIRNDSVDTFRSFCGFAAALPTAHMTTKERDSYNRIRNDILTKFCDLISCINEFDVGNKGAIIRERIEKGITDLSSLSQEIVNMTNTNPINAKEKFLKEMEILENVISQMPPSIIITHETLGMIYAIGQAIERMLLLWEQFPSIYDDQLHWPRLQNMVHQYQRKCATIQTTNNHETRNNEATSDNRKFEFLRDRIKEDLDKLAFHIQWACGASGNERTENYVEIYSLNVTPSCLLSYHKKK